MIGQKFHSKSESRKEEAITLIDILDIRYKHYKVGKKIQIGQNQIEESIGTLNGDFSPLQSQHFFERYDLLEHCPNTESSGFSATFFYNKESKEYTLAIRGTEFKLEQIQDLLNDYYIGTNNSDMNRVIEQYFDMLLFYEETLKPLLQEKGIARINVVGHSLGGYLAQLFALSYPHSINEVYTYNAPLESKSIA